MTRRKLAVLLAFFAILSTHRALASDQASASAPGASYFTVTPCRLLDTRGPLGGPTLAAGEKRIIAVAGSCAIPSNALSVQINLAVVSPAASGHAKVFAGDAAAPLTSMLNFSAGQTRASNTIVQLAGNGSGTIALQNGSSGSADYLLDVWGYFACGAITVAPPGPALPAGTSGTTYSQAFTASGGSGNYAFTVTSGLLPSGLLLSAAGLLSGTPTQSGDFSFTVTATDTVTGCAGSGAYTLHINCGTLTVAITPTPAQVCAGSAGNAASATAGFATYAWSITNGTITSATNTQAISYTAGSSGSVGLTVDVTDSSACPGQAASSVPINAPPATPSIATSNPQTFTVGGASGTFTLTFQGQTTGSLAFNATAAQVQTALNALSTIGGAGGSVTVIQAAGVYTVTFGGTLTGPQPQMTASAAGGCTAVVSGPAVCAGSTGNQASGPAGATTYAWTITNGTITSATNIQTITYTAGSAGTATLALTVTNAAGCAASNSAPVTVNPTPATPVITPTPAQVCAGSTGNTASGPAGATTYAWTIANGTITSAADIQAITYTAGASGNVTLNLTVTNASGCAASDSILVPINNTPTTPSITPTPAQVCSGSTGNTASGPAGATTYAWTISNGTITSATNIQTITYTAGASGSVTLNLTVTNGAACAASNSALVPISALPATPAIATSNPQTFTVSGGSGSFTLTFQGQTTGSLAFNATAAQVQTALNALSTIGGAGGSVTVIQAAGVYTVTFGGALTGPQPQMTASAAGGCTVVVSGPAVCADSTGNQASGPAGATTYAWTITNGTITSATNIQTITYSAGSSGTVTLNLTVTNAAACSASNSALLTINPTPATPTITPTPAQVCANSTGNTADGPAGATTYAWTITNGTITSATNIQTITYTAGASGTVTLNLTVTNASNCPASNSLDVTINPAPATPTITPTPAQVCAGSAGNTASGPAGATTYAWSITNGTITSAANIQTITYTAGVAAGNVGLTLVVTNAQGCSATNTVNVTKNPTPAFTPAPGALSVATFNVAYALTFSGTTGTAPFTFTLASGALPTGMTLNSNGSVSPNTPSATGPFAFSITVTDAKGCSSTQGYTLNVQPNLTIKSFGDVGNTQLTGGIAVGTPAVSVVPVSSGDTSDTTITYAVTVLPIHGTLTTFNANGTFLYTPNVGNTTADAFTYTGTSNGISATRTATIAFSGMVWYVDNATLSGTNDGRSNTPLKTMTAVGGAATNNGDFIYVAHGSGSTTGAYTMKPSQQLIGAGATLNVPTAGTLLTVAGNAANTPTLGGTVTLANTVTVNGIDMSTGASRAITNFNGVSYSTVTGVSVTARAVASTTGTAIDIQAAGNTGTMTFTSVSANSAASGIVLQNFTGGSFTITGDNNGSSNNGSGGTISASIAEGILVNTAGTISLAYMNVQNSGTKGISVTGSTGFTLDHSNVTDNAGGATDEGVNLINNTGTITLSNDVVDSAPHNQVNIDNFNTNLTAINATNSTFKCTAGNACQPSGSVGGNAMLVQIRGTSVLTSANVQGCTFSGVRSTGLLVTGADTASIGSSSGGVITAPAASHSFVVQSCTVTNNNAGIDISKSQSSSVTFQMLNNTLNGQHSQAINSFSGAGSGFGGTITGFISGNQIGTQGTKDSGSAIGSGIRLIVQGDSTQGFYTVDGNTIREVPNAGNGIISLFSQNGDAVSGTGSARFKITNNTLPAPSGTNQSIGCGAGVPCLDDGIFLLADEHNSACALITGNNIFDVSAFPAGVDDVYLAARTGPPTGATITIQTGANGGSSAAALAFLNANNTLNGANNSFDESGTVTTVSSCGSFPP